MLLKACQAAILKLMSLKINWLLPIYISIVPLKFGVDIQSQTKVRVRKPKIQYGCQAAVLILTLLKINKLLSIYISIVTLKFGDDSQSQTKVRVWKPKKSNMATRQPYCKWRRWASIGPLPMTTINMHMKFEIEIPKQTWLMLQKPCCLQSPETEKSNMATRRPFWKWHCWKSIGSYPYT